MSTNVGQNQIGASNRRGQDTNSRVTGRRQAKVTRRRFNKVPVVRRRTRTSARRRRISRHNRQDVAQKEPNSSVQVNNRHCTAGHRSANHRAVRTVGRVSHISQNSSRRYNSHRKRAQQNNGRQVTRER